LQSNSKLGVRNLCGVAALLFVTVAAATQSAQAASAEPTDWCALVQGPDGGYVSCGYSTRAQCLEALSGVGGICHENPAAGPVINGRPTERTQRRNRP
jgi:hypothetical protein